jgi:hypothetical protein
MERQMEIRTAILRPYEAEEPAETIEDLLSDGSRDWVDALDELSSISPETYLARIEA